MNPVIVLKSLRIPQRRKKMWLHRPEKVTSSQEKAVLNSVEMRGRQRA